VNRVKYRAISERARGQLKLHVLDSLGCAIGALPAEPIAAIRTHLEDFGGNPACTLIGGGKTAPDRAAFYNGALVGAALRGKGLISSYFAPRLSGTACRIVS